MRHVARLTLCGPLLITLSFASATSAQVQTSSLHSYEIEVKTDSPVTLWVYVNGAFDDDFLVTPVSGPDWTGDLNGGNGVYDWQHSWGSTSDELAFVFRSGSTTIAKYIYVPYALEYGPQSYSNKHGTEDFYFPITAENGVPLPSITPDVYFEYKNGAVTASSASSSSTKFETSLGTLYTLPYDRGTGNLPYLGFFLSRVPTSQSLSSRSFTLAGDATIPSNWNLDWDVAGLDVRFGSGKKLTVQGTLDVEGAVLRPTGSTWGGVTVSNGTLTFDGAKVLDVSGNGVYATGSSADVTITGPSEIGNSSGYGVYANSGAGVTINDGAKIINSGVYGVRSRGSGTDVLIENAFVQGSGSYATLSDFYGDIDLRNVNGAAKLNGNTNGINGQTGGQVDTGTSGGNRAVQDPNAPSSAYDVFAMDAAFVDIDRIFWGVGITSASQLDVLDGDPDVLIINPVLTYDPAGGGTGALHASMPSRTIGSADGSASARDAAPSIPYATQLGTGTAQGYVEAAEESEDAGEAVDALLSALDAASTEAEHQMAWTAAARLAVRLQTRMKDPVASARLGATATAALGTPQAPWARRVLALSAAHAAPEARGTVQEHLAALAALPAGEARRSAAEATPLSHAAFARLLAVQVALDDRDARGALDALAALAALDPYQASEAAVDIAAVLPEADVEEALLRARESARLQTADIAQESASTAAFSVAPNPSAGRVRLRFEVADASDVEVAVYDALGRRVATALQGAFGAGVHEAPIDLSALPAGLYVARLVADGAVETVRFTVTR